MVFNIMFERATAFSAIFVFVAFSIASMKYIEFMEAKNQSDSPSVTSSQ